MGFFVVDVDDRIVSDTDGDHVFIRKGFNLFNFEIFVAVLTDIYHCPSPVIVLRVVGTPPSMGWEPCSAFGLGVPNQTHFL